MTHITSGPGLAIKPPVPPQYPKRFPKQTAKGLFITQINDQHLLNTATAVLWRISPPNAYLILEALVVSNMAKAQLAASKMVYRERRSSRLEKIQ